MEIESQCLVKFTQIEVFDSRAIKSITYAIYVTPTVDIYTKSLDLLHIRKLENDLIILNQTWMKEHEVIIDITSNSLVF